MHLKPHYYLWVALFCCGYLFPSLTQAQSNSCGDVVLRTQAEVDAFDCTSAESITIAMDGDPDDNTTGGPDDPITNLINMSTLIEVTGDLRITRKRPGLSSGILLANFEGLQNLETIGGSFLPDDETARSLNGLEKLTFIGGTFRVSSGTIDDFSGLENLLRIGGGFDVIGIDSFVGLSNLQQIDGHFRIGSSSAKDFTGLPRLTSVGGLSLLANTVLESFEGLTSLQTIEDTLLIEKQSPSTNIEEPLNISFVGLENIEELGSLIIFGGVIGDFQGLNNLERIRDQFSITFTCEVGSLTGLEKLVSVGGALTIEENNACRGRAGEGGPSDLNGLQGLRQVGSLTVDVASLDGLDQLREVTSSATLSTDNLSALGNLTTVGEDFIINRGNFTDLSGLMSLTSVGRNLTINNGGFADLSGLENLDSVGEDVQINNNANLSDISALENIVDIGGDLQIAFNSVLSSCCVLSDIREKVQGSVILSNNDEGCLNIAEVETSCNQGNGVTYQYYEGTWEVLPDFDQQTVVSTGTLPNFSLSPAQQNGSYGFQYTTYLNVTTPGEYTFYTTSADGSKLYINEQLVVDNDGIHAAREESGEIMLPAGRQKLRVEYFVHDRDDALLEVRYAGPGISKQLVPDEVIFINDEQVNPSCENVVLSTQAEVDAFDCALVFDLTIDVSDEDSEDPIVDLSGLSLLSQVRNDLTITGKRSADAPALSNLEGLNNLISINGDFVFSANLPNLQGLSGLSTIGGSFQLLEGVFGRRREFSELKSLKGLESLKSVGGDLTLQYPLEDFSGLDKLKTVGGEISIDSKGLVRFNGLSALETIGGLSVPGFVSDFVGLSALTTINGSVAIGGEDSWGVNSFRGLERLEAISGDVIIKLFDNFNDWQGLGSLRRIGGSFLILPNSNFDNFLGLENLEEIGGRFRIRFSEIKSLRGLSSLQSIGDLFQIENSTIESLQGLSSLQSVGGLFLSSVKELASLEGLEALRQIANDIFITETSVADISTLTTVESVGGDLLISLNRSLSTCCALFTLKKRTTGSVTARFNAEGCNSLQQIEAACDEVARVSYRYYEGEWDKLPDFSALDAVKTGTLSNFGLNPAEQEDFYGFTYRTYLEVSTRRRVYLLTPILTMVVNYSSTTN